MILSFLGAKYSSIEEVALALKQRKVRGALVDIFSAASRSDLFLQSDIVAKRTIRYPSAYGFVLSGDMNNAAEDFRSYLRSRVDVVLNFVEKRIAGFEVCSFKLTFTFYHFYFQY